MSSTALVGLKSNSASARVSPGAQVLLTAGYAAAGRGAARYVLEDAMAVRTTMHPRAVLNTDDGRRFRLTEDEITPEMFGAVGDGVVDDGDAISAANAYCADYRLALRFTAPVYNVGVKAFRISAHLSRWYSSARSTLRWSGLPAEGAPALNVIGDSTYAQLDRQNRSVIENLHFASTRGQQGLAATLLRLGDGTDANGLSLATFNGCSFNGFQTLVEFTDHVWRLCFRDCRFVWGDIITPAKTANFGERMTFDNCMIADMPNNGMVLRRGSWQFTSCSLDNAQLVASNDAIVNFDGGHFENPGSSRQQPRYLIVQDEALVFIRGSWICWNPPAPDRKISRPLFHCATRPGTNAGLVIDGCVMVIGGGYDPQSGGFPHVSLCEGEGRVSARAMRWLAWENKHYILIGQGAQVIANGDFNDQSVQGYTFDRIVGKGSANFAIAKSVGKFGAQCGRISLKSGIGTITEGRLRLRVNLSPGDTILGGFWFRAGTSGAANLAVRFDWAYSGAAELTHLPDRGSTPLLLSENWNYHRFGLIAPAGARLIDLDIIARINGSDASAEAFLDQILVNIIAG